VSKKSSVVTINRAPVLTLWAAVVAERLGYDGDESLTLGKAVAGLNAQAKGRRLGIYKPGQVQGKKRARSGLGEELWLDLCGRAVPAVSTDEGIRAVVRDRPIDPASVARYLDKKFGGDLAAVREAMTTLADALNVDELADEAYSLYEQFRPDIPPGTRGWGAKGALDLNFIRSLA
jgi:hypothetical protein